MSQVELLHEFLLEEDFGKGKFLGDDPRINDLNPENRVYVSAWRHACPQPDATVKYYGDEWLKYWHHFVKQGNEPDPTPETIKEHGIEITRRRYDECDRVYSDIVEKTRTSGNTDLLSALTGSVQRRNGERAGYHEESRVPESHANQMSPLSRLVGYALPRVIIEQFGWGDEQRSWGDGNRTWERYEKGMIILDKAIKKAKTPIQLLCILAEEVYKNDGDAQKILGHILAEGIENEENNHTEFEEVKQGLHKYARTLWANH